MNDSGRNLRLPQGLNYGPGQTQAQAVMTKWHTIDDVQEESLLRGFPEKVKPEFECPQLDVETLTSNDSKAYTQKYTELLAWFGYAGELLALIHARVLQLKNMQDILAAEGRKTLRDLKSGVKKPTKEEIEDYLTLNPEYQDVTLQLQRFQQAKLLYDAKVDSIERSLRVISRQIEIRRLDIEQNRTDGGMSNRGVMGQNRFGGRSPT